jgi:hypothetical protein
MSEAASVADSAATLSLKCLVTGGNTGADSIAFHTFDQCGQALGFSVKGFMPQGYSRADGTGEMIAAKYGLLEGSTGPLTTTLRNGELQTTTYGNKYEWRDTANMMQSDALVAFLTTQPLTGKGTRSTIHAFVEGTYEFKPELWEKPSDASHLHIEGGIKPVIVLWDVNDSRVAEDSRIVASWLQRYAPQNLMLSGSLAKTCPEVEAVGTQILVNAICSLHAHGS